MCPQRHLNWFAVRPKRRSMDGSSLLPAACCPSARVPWVLGLLACFFASGCAIQYYDKQSGTEHLWGFGHLKMRAAARREDQPPFTNAVMAYALRTQTLGLNLGAGQEFAGVAAGWDCRSRVIIKTEDSSFYLLWPTNALWLPGHMKSLFNVRVGPEFPFTNSVATPESNPQQPSP